MWPNKTMNMKKMPEIFTEADSSRLDKLNRAWFLAYVKESAPESITEAVRLYVETKPVLAQAVGRFGIINNRLFKDRDLLFVPYLVKTLVVKKMNHIF
jgi:hypothetical protein